jgi:chromosome partitioning protein
MQRIVVLNPKGGSGKTTIATNLAACYAVTGTGAALMDLDPQGSSIRWLRKRPSEQTSIHGIAAFERSTSVTRSWQLRVPAECRALVVDTPAALEPQRLPEITRGADAILVPVMPSDIDIHAAAKCVADLLLVAKIRRSERRLGIIANRVRTNTRVHYRLMRFLDSLAIPLVATFRDAQSYVRSAELGLGIHELPHWQVQRDLDQWENLICWLNRLTEPGRPQRPGGVSQPDHLHPGQLAPLGRVHVERHGASDLEEPDQPRFNGLYSELNGSAIPQR